MAEVPPIRLSHNEAVFCLVDAQEVRDLWWRLAREAVLCGRFDQERLDFFLDQTICFDGLIAKLEPIVEAYRQHSAVGPAS